MKNIYFLTIKLKIIKLSVFYYIDNDTDKLYNVRINEQRGGIMDFMTKEDFINESNIEIIQKLMERNNGYITTKALEDFDISRNYLSIMTKKR